MACFKGRPHDRRSSTSALSVSLRSLLATGLVLIGVVRTRCGGEVSRLARPLVTLEAGVVRHQRLEVLDFLDFRRVTNAVKGVESAMKWIGISCHAVRISSDENFS